MNTIPSDIYYVYYYLRTQDSSTGKKGTPYYVGKGKGGRITRSHGTTAVPKDTINRFKIADCLSEEAAHQIEKVHIAMWGRVDLGTGILRNRTNGGEGSSGYKWSEEDVKKRSEKLKKTLQRPEVKLKRSIAMKEAQSRLEVNIKRSQSLKIFNSNTSSTERSARQRIVQNNLETNTKRSQSLKITNSNPDVIARRRAAQLNPEVAEKRAALEANSLYKSMKSERARESGSKPEVKERSRAARQAYLSNPNNRIPCEYCNKPCLKSDYVKNHGKSCKLKCQ